MPRLIPIEKRGRVVAWVPPEGTHYIALDLDVFSRNRLDGLVVALGDGVRVLYEGRCGGRYLASFQLRRSWQLSADQGIRRLVALVRSLPLSARRLWNESQSRVFDIGIEAALSAPTR